MSDRDAPVLMGVIGGAHGIRGECRVKSFTEDPEDLGAYGPLTDTSGRTFTVLSARLQKNVVIVRFREVTDRNAAEALNGTQLFVARSRLPEDGEDFYQADLVGLDARSIDGTVLGQIVAFHNFGAGDILEIQPETGGAVMIPFTRAAVPDIDLELGAITVEPVAAGLKDAVEARPAPGEEEGTA